MLFDPETVPEADVTVPDSAQAWLLERGPFKRLALAVGRGKSTIASVNLEPTDSQSDALETLLRYTLGQPGVYRITGTLTDSTQRIAHDLKIEDENAISADAKHTDPTVQILSRTVLALANKNSEMARHIVNVQGRMLESLTNERERLAQTHQEALRMKAESEAKTHSAAAQVEALKTVQILLMAKKQNGPQPIAAAPSSSDAPQKSREQAAFEKLTPEGQKMILEKWGRVPTIAELAKLAAENQGELLAFMAALPDSDSELLGAMFASL